MFQAPSRMPTQSESSVNVSLLPSKRHFVALSFLGAGETLKDETARRGAGTRSLLEPLSRSQNKKRCNSDTFNHISRFGPSRRAARYSEASVHAKSRLLISQFVRDQRDQIEAVAPNAMQPAHKNPFTEFHRHLSPVQRNMATLARLLQKICKLRKT